MIFFSKQFARRRSEKQYETKPIGSAIKIKRKELRMTLDESSEGICSISYLSKLENNLIEPNDSFVSQLMKRLNLKEDEEIEYGTYKKDLEYLLECMLQDTLPSIVNINKYYNHQDQQSLLILICYNGLLNQQREVIKSYERIKLFIPNLDNFEAAMLSLCMSITFYKSEQYQLAYDVLKIGARHKSGLGTLEILIMKWTLFSAFKMRRINDMTNLYDKFLNIATERQCFQILKDVNLEYYKLYSVYEEPEQMRMLMDTIRDFSKEEKDLIHARALFTKKQYVKLYHISKEYLDKDSEWFMLHAICLDAQSKETELMKLIEKAEQNKNLNDTSNILIRHMKVKYKKEKDELLRYLRNDILNHQLSIDNYDVIEYLLTDASQLFSDHQFYKEANQIAHEMVLNLKKLKMSIQNYNDED